MQQHNRAGAVWRGDDYFHNDDGEGARVDSTGACQQYNRAVHSAVKAALDVNVAAASGPNSDFLMKRIIATKNYSSGGLKRSQIDRIRNVGL